ncbi:MAG: hypothetical protein KJ737_08305 [Proteobacteria bacterium]|nr:hypothetical protein [Pseudomonadota bacterium]
MIGFKLDEVMTGTHEFSEVGWPKGMHPFHYSLTWGNQNLLNFLNPFSKEFLSSETKGIITIGGLVNKAVCQGTLQMLYFSERKIRYDFTFKDNKGAPYRYVGEKINLWPWNLHKTHVTCYGTVTHLDTGKNISTSVVYFPYREIIPFIFSFRLRWGKVFKYPAGGFHDI